MSHLDVESAVRCDGLWLGVFKESDTRSWIENVETDFLEMWIL